MASTQKRIPLGCLTSLGVKEVWQAALYLPSGWQDFRTPITEWDAASLFHMEGKRVLLQGYFGMPSARFNNRNIPQMNCLLSDMRRFGSAQFYVYGDSRELQLEIEGLQDVPVYVCAEVSSLNGNLVLKKMEIVDRKWVGKMCPIYPGRPRAVNAEVVRDGIGGLLVEAIPSAVQYICEEIELCNEDAVRFLDVGQDTNLERILYRAHRPLNKAQGMKAQACIERLAAYRAIRVARKQMPSAFEPVRLPNPIRDWRHLESGLPFSLSPKQRHAVSEIVDDIAQEKPMRRLLSGDVGYGKTAVFGVASMALYRAGGRVALLMPSQTLAEQTYRELTHYWPDAKQDFCLVTEDTDRNLDLTCFRYLVGTTALLFREAGEFQLVVVDEQHKFALEQREKLIGMACHLLEATATCIPRSQALIQFGGFQQTILDEPPVRKDIKTVIRYEEDRRGLFDDIKATLGDGDQVLIIYPKKKSSERRMGNLGSGMIADVETSAPAWEKAFPGQVRSVHAGRSSAENEQALSDMREKKASILIGTIVVEVGVNIPNLRRVVVVHPHRFGLSTLHQIRGRVARTGGKGYCDLYLPEVPKSGIERLQILERTNNGFEIAREDLRIRGCGDLSRKSRKQSGSDESILFNRLLLPNRLEEAVDLEKRFNERNCNPA